MQTRVFLHEWENRNACLHGGKDEYVQRPSRTGGKGVNTCKESLSKNIRGSW